MNIGFYAGSFDPFTFGHLHIIKKSSLIFDKVIVGIGSNPSKSRTVMSPSFTALSSTTTVLALFSLSLLIASFTSSSVTSTSDFSTSTPLYLPSSTSGFYATSAVKMNGFPASICTTSIVG